MLSEVLISKLLDEITEYDLELARVMGMKETPGPADIRHRNRIMITALLGERERCRAAVQQERERRAAGRY